MWFKRFTIIFLFTGISVCFGQKSFHGKVELSSSPDRLILMDLLRSRQYETLINKLDGYLFSALQDYRAEDNLWLAFGTFDIPHSAVEPFLNEMIKKFPESSIAYAARAVYYEKIGWNVRGYDWAKNVTPAQWEGMHNYFSKSINDAIVGLKLNSGNLVCYKVLLTISMNLGTKDITRKFLDEALKISPYSMGLRRSYIWSLLPRWGGSQEEMLEFAKESQQYADKNPKLKSLFGYIPFDEGWSLQNSEDYKSAILFFNKALSYGERADFYEHRGDCYFELEEYEKALHDYEKALELSPQDEDLLRDEGMALHALGRSNEAKQVLETASKISPTDRYIQRSKERVNKEEANDHIRNGVNLDRQGKYEEAIREYDQAIQENPDDYLSYYDRGIALMKLNRYDDALRDFEHAVARNISYTACYNNIGWIRLQQNRFDDAIVAYTRIIDLEPKEGKAYVNRAYAYIQIGRRDAAIRDLKSACDLSISDACRKLKELRGY